jgi:hypothetical protein
MPRRYNLRKRDPSVKWIEDDTLKETEESEDEDYYVPPTEEESAVEEEDVTEEERRTKTLRTRRKRQEAPEQFIKVPDPQSMASSASKIDNREPSRDVCR